jgi:hypothetical protein
VSVDATGPPGEQVVDALVNASRRCRYGHDVTRETAHIGSYGQVECRRCRQLREQAVLRSMRLPNGWPRRMDLCGHKPLTARAPALRDGP